MKKLYDNSEEVIRAIRDLTDEVLVHFSLGKDSLATLVKMTENFPKVHVVHYYQIPDLGFVEEQLKVVEDWFGSHIHRIPWPDIYSKVFSQGFYWPFGIYEPLTDNSIPYFADDLDVHTDIRVGFCRDVLGCPEDDPMWTARGFRTADSMTRRQMMTRHGHVHPDTKIFDPIWDWKKEKVLDTIAQAGLTLSQDYVLFGRSWEGIDSLSIEAVRQHYPDDYQKILEWNPMAFVAASRQAMVIKKYGIDDRSWRQRMIDGDAVTR